MTLIGGRAATVHKISIFGGIFQNLKKNQYRFWSYGPTKVPGPGLQGPVQRLSETLKNVGTFFYMYP